MKLSLQNLLSVHSGDFPVFNFAYKSYNSRFAG
jgi:hypothetical protein